MMAFKSFFRRLRVNAKVQTVIYIALSALMLFAMYILRDGQPCTCLQALRRAERASFMGPGEIVEKLPISDGLHEGVYVLREGDGFALGVTERQTVGSIFRFSHTDAHILPVDTRPGVTFATACPQVGGPDGPNYLFVFDDYPLARRAELELRYIGDDPDTGSECLTLEAMREIDGMFTFVFGSDTQNRDALDVDGHFGNDFYYGEDTLLKWGVDLSLRLYGEGGDLIAEEHALWDLY